MPENIHTVTVTKLGKCGVCKRWVREGDTLQFVLRDDTYKCRHR